MKMVLGPELKKAREKLGWTQAKLSEAARINISTISRLERGKFGRIRSTTMKDICAALNVKPSDLGFRPIKWLA